MGDSNEIATNPVRELARDSATDSVPVSIDDRLTFTEWADAVDVVASDLEWTIEREVPA